MLYPLKFTPLYKHSLWGGRALEKLGRKLPEGKVGESWEVACHADGESVIANGEYSGMPVGAWIKAFKDQAVGKDIFLKYRGNLPILVKLIDASERLSVQVHPSDKTAKRLENELYGKNEMWYILSAAPNSKIVYDFAPGLSRSAIEGCIKEECLESCLNYLDVEAEDAIYVPAGTVHALGAGIVAVEIQQSSNITYRIFDYNRVTNTGVKRELHIEKALAAMEDHAAVKGRIHGLQRQATSDYAATFLIANNHFAVELYKVNGKIEECTDGRFHIYTIVEGEGEVGFNGGSMPVRAVESIFIPAALVKYYFSGKLKMLKTYVPKLKKHVVEPLKRAGFSDSEIVRNIHGWQLSA